jgi:alpha-tubulin suppressor-like RCC1 family protein
MCVLLYDASIACAGCGYRGELGNGKLTQQNVLMAASAFAGIPASALAVGSGDGGFACVLAATSDVNQVYCLGTKSNGVLGSGEFPVGYSKKPVALQGLKPTPRIGQLVGTFGVCASYSGTGDFDTVQCWGNGYGPTPIDIAGTAGTVAMAASDNPLCVVLSDQTVSCWKTPYVAAVQVGGISSAVRVAASTGFACAVVRSTGSPGALWCWGKDSATNGVISNSITPWWVEALAGNVLDVAAGMSHVCVLLEVATGSGDVYCLGNNYYAQLGQGYTNNSNPHPGDGVMPQLRVKGISKVTALIPGFQTTCALTVSQRVVCWGENTYGQLCAGTDVSPVTLPVVVRSLCA